MFNKSLYLLAYGNIYSNQGAMTPWACDETADGMSEEKIDQMIAAMRGERYLFAPVRSVHIPEEEREAASPRPAVMVRQDRRRGGAAPAGGVLRADVLFEFARADPGRARTLTDACQQAGGPATVHRRGSRQTTHPRAARNHLGGRPRGRTH
jgi:hypothetical protein